MGYIKAVEHREVWCNRITEEAMKKEKEKKKKKRTVERRRAPLCRSRSR
jgi:hypothetical protein